MRGCAIVAPIISSQETVGQQYGASLFSRLAPFLPARENGDGDAYAPEARRGVAWWLLRTCCTTDDDATPTNDGSDACGFFLLCVQVSYLPVGVQFEVETREREEDGARSPRRRGRRCYGVLQQETLFADDMHPATREFHLFSVYTFIFITFAPVKSVLLG